MAKFTKKPVLKPILEKRVGDYINQHRQSGYRKMLLKAGFFIALAALFYWLLVFGDNSMAQAIAYAFGLALMLLFIGFNIMHDAVHGSFSDNKTINGLARMATDLVGANSCIWEMKHNFSHHVFTNIPEEDPDINFRGFARLSDGEPWRSGYRFQHFYVWFLYSFVHLRFALMDLKQLVFLCFGKDNDFTQSFRKKKDKANFYLMVVGKILFVSLFIIIPLIFHDWYKVLAFYLGVTGFMGLGLSVIFQLAHSVDNVYHPKPNDNYGQDEWVVHQIRTTSNFATNNFVVTFLLGGLNFQREHHLFSDVSHVHYPAVAKIVKETCAEYHIPALEHSTLRSALISHYNFLKVMGKPPESSPTSPSLAV